jgi:hypothetical protein
MWNIGATTEADALIRVVIIPGRSKDVFHKDVVVDLMREARRDLG